MGNGACGPDENVSTATLPPIGKAHSLESATGTTTVTGHVEERTAPPWDPDRHPPYDLLTAIEFVSSGPQTNDVMFAAADQHVETFECENPPVGYVTGPCVVYTNPARYVVTDASVDVVAEQACDLVSPGVAECHSPDGLYARSSYLTLGLDVVLGEGNDSFKAVLPNGDVRQWETYSITVDGGPGDDTIVVLDTTEYGPDFREGADSVLCGDGVDTAIVSPSVETFGCELVTTIVG